MSAWSTSVMAIGRRPAAIRPAKPRPTGRPTPCSTSSSMPLAARACNSSPSSSRIATVSASEGLVDAREQPQEQAPCSGRYASGASFDAVARFERPAFSRPPPPLALPRSPSSMRVCSIASAARSAASWSRSRSSSENTRGARLPTRRCRCRRPATSSWTPRRHGCPSRARSRSSTSAWLVVGDGDRATLGPHPPGEAAADRDANACLSSSSMPFRARAG